MDWKKIAVLVILAAVLTAPITGGWYLTRPVHASVNGGIAFDCGTPLDPAAPSDAGAPLPGAGPRSACDTAVAEARAGGGGAVIVGLFAWAVVVVVRRRRSGREPAAGDGVDDLDAGAMSGASVGPLLR